MKFFRAFARAIIKYPIRWLISVKSVPTNIEGELGIDKNRPILYLMQTDSYTDQTALRLSARGLGLPDPTDTIDVLGQLRPRCYFLNQPQSLFTRRVEKTTFEEVFTEFFHLHRENPELDLQVVPVFISWGRAAGKSTSGFADLLADRASPSWLRKLIIVLFLGRDNFVSYSKAVSTQKMALFHGSDQKLAQKLVRVTSTHFHRKRQTLTGPTLLERSTLYNSVLGSQSVKQAIKEETGTKYSSKQEARDAAKLYIKEIAADYREGLIRIGDRILTRIWNKIYNGIHVRHARRVRELAQNGHEIVYVPCHRSHMDYLLLTYVIYHEGLVTPHIAAGINLNFWPVGKIFRRGGAFFLRRSFAGNKLYTAVFREYLELLFNKGYSVKYYPEGGRSRTGRLLPPKTGMFAMTLQAVMKGINRPVSIVPVYIGYEHVMEVKSYQKELTGKKKTKESSWQVFGAIRKLKNYGFGFVNFGEPIQINQFLDKQAPTWREDIQANPDKKQSWLTPAVNVLADKVMRRINKAAALNGTALVALCLLSSKMQTMSKASLRKAIHDYLAMFAALPYSEDFTQPPESADDILTATLALNRFEQTKDELGYLISTRPENEITLTYYRNNILHVFALPSLVMSIVFAHKGITKARLMDLVEKLFPLLRREFFIYMTLNDALVYCHKLIDVYKELGMLNENDHFITAPDTQSVSFHSSWLLSRAMQETWQRHIVVLAVLEKEKSISRARLEKRSVDVAEHLSSLYGMNSPEFYDKNVLSSFITALRENHCLPTNEEGNLTFSETSLVLKDAITPLVWPEIVQHLETI